MNVGIGVMALPSAFYNSGMAVGIAAMVFMASITVHCMHLLVSKQPFWKKKLKNKQIYVSTVVPRKLEKNAALYQ